MTSASLTSRLPIVFKVMSLLLCRLCYWYEIIARSFTWLDTRIQSSILDSVWMLCGSCAIAVWPTISIASVNLTKIPIKQGLQMLSSSDKKWNFVETRTCVWLASVRFVYPVLRWSGIIWANDQLLGPTGVSFDITFQVTTCRVADRLTIRWPRSSMTTMSQFCLGNLLHCYDVSASFSCCSLLLILLW